jgi:hypothetical protein
MLGSSQMVMRREGPHPLSRTAAKNLADRSENDLRRPPVIRSEEELKLILTALRYYGHAPFGEQKLPKTGGVVTAA